VADVPTVAEFEARTLAAASYATAAALAAAIAGISSGGGYGHMLSAAEVTAMRAVQTDTLPDTCTILEKTQTTDGLGGHTWAWSARGTALCRVGSLGWQPTEEMPRNAPVARPQEEQQDAWIITLPAQTACYAEDRIMVTTQGSAVYEVIGQKAPHSWETARQMICYSLGDEVSTNEVIAATLDKVVWA